MENLLARITLNPAVSQSGETNAAQYAVYRGATAGIISGWHD